MNKIYWLLAICCFGCTFPSVDYCTVDKIDDCQKQFCNGEVEQVVNLPDDTVCGKQLAKTQWSGICKMGICIESCDTDNDCSHDRICNLQTKLCEQSVK